MNVTSTGNERTHENFFGTKSIVITANKDGKTQETFSNNFDDLN